jgi:hypothetical protein
MMLELSNGIDNNPGFSDATGHFTQVRDSSVSDGSIVDLFCAYLGRLEVIYYTWLRSSQMHHG